MGQATVDLPDPLETPAPSSSAGTDDLLAQLAGEEIDRLLADADSGLPPASPTPTDEVDAPPPSVAATVPAPAPVAAPAVFRIHADEPVPLPAPTANTVTDETDQELATALDNLLHGLNTGPEASAAKAQAEADADALDPTAGSATPIVPQVERRTAKSAVADELETSEQERDALRSPEPRIAEADAISAPADDETEQPLPFYLKPLEWLSAPLSDAPESVREVIGKLAILTLVNAIAVLLYVLFIRRH